MSNSEKLTLPKEAKYGIDFSFKIPDDVKPQLLNTSNKIMPNWPQKLISIATQLAHLKQTSEKIIKTIKRIHR